MIIKTQEEIEIIKEGGKILASAMDAVIEAAKPGVTTEELDAIAEKVLTDAGARPAFKGYEPAFGHGAFPTTLCTSVNHEIVHTPANKGVTLQEGDLLGIDMGAQYKSMYTDMARTIPIGNVSKESRELLLTTQAALDAATNALVDAESMYAVGEAVENVVQGQFGIIKDLVGHGVGKEIHESPNITNFRYSPMKQVPVKPGMVFAIEPMLTTGTDQIVLGDDNWSYETADGSLAAQFENTIAINHDGTVEILTPTKWRMK